MMRICFMISNINTRSNGNGGHYYSLISTASALSELIDISILNIGTNKSIALEDSALRVTNIVSNKNTIISILSLIKRSRAFFKNEKFDVIHAFDDLAFFFGRINSSRYKIPIVLTKCGGPNPKLYYPNSKDLILFSQENLNYFKGNKRFKNSNIYLIPNRINNVYQDKSRISKLINKYDLESYDFVLLRIARIGNAYKKSIDQIIEVKKKMSTDISSAVLIIGSIESREVYEEINKYEVPDLFIETDEIFTKKASELISVADIVLGTGRSFMEASILSKLMLAPIKNSDYPVIVDVHNFNLLASFNFSPRTNLKSFSRNKEIIKMNAILKNKDILHDFITEHDDLFKTKFQLSFVSEEYLSIYKNLKFYPIKIKIDVFLNLFVLIRTLYQNKR